MRATFINFFSPYFSDCILCLLFCSDGVVIVNEPNISWAPSVSSDKLFVTRRSFVLSVARQHALDTHADALDGLDR